MNKETKKDYGDNLIKQLTLINELLSQSRKRGIQMKVLAEAINVSPPVLSAFYRTVMPAFMDNYARMGVDDALEYAFSLVNNISKTRFTPFFPNIILALESVLNAEIIDNKNDEKSSIDDFVSTVNSSQEALQAVEGIYRTYSLSSGDYSMKCEPMIISRNSTNAIKVSRLSVHNVIQEGFGMIAANQTLALYLNEAKYPKYYPLTLFINIPFCFSPKIYRGVYLAMDSSNHPLARRIVIEKISSSTNISLFGEERPILYHAAQIPEELKEYFDYIKERSDVLRVSVIPEPTADSRDLIVEKKLLKIYEDL